MPIDSEHQDLPTLPPAKTPQATAVEVTLAHVTPPYEAPSVAAQAPEVWSSGARPTSTLPRVFGDYEILSELARGGMGVVYKARQISLNRIVALKMILAGQLASEDDVKRFYFEAESAAQLEHPHIVPIYEIGSHNGQHFFSMGFVEGPSLATLLRDGPLPLRDAAEMLLRVCDAIQYAHDRGVIHRDLKPGNILLSMDVHTSDASTTKVRPLGSSAFSGLTSFPNERGSSRSAPKKNASARKHEFKAATSSDATTLVEKFSRERSARTMNLAPKVTDFGLAKQLQGGSELTGTGQILGTPSYMPPEQADGRQAVGTEADVYAIGAILYCMLTGRPPFQSSNPVDTLMQVLNAQPIAPRQLNPSVPRDLETICLKCLEKVPAKRYLSARELRDEFAHYLNDEPISARPISNVERGIRWLRRHPAVGVVAASVLLSIGAVIGTIAIANRRLQSERDIAIGAKNAAQVQKTLAQGRLDKAIEAVDKMMVRVATERWMTNPVLQEERRRVLEDAVDFYNSFVDETQQDPRVQRETAKAQFRVSTTYLMMNELDSARAANDKAATLYGELIEGNPQDAALVCEASEVISMSGNVAALMGQYAEALRDYSKAIEYAQRASALQPNDERTQVQLVDAQSHLCYFLLSFDPLEGRKLLPVLVPLARRCGEGEQASYMGRLALAFALTVEAAYHITANEFPAAFNLYSEGDAILKKLQQLTAPTTRLAQHCNYTQAIVTVSLGLVQGIGGQDPSAKQQGIARIREGIQQFDRLLVVTPKSFPYRLQKLQALQGLTNVHRLLSENQAAAECERQCAALLSDLIAENPNLVWLAGLDARRRSLELVNNLKAGNLSGFEKQVKELLAITVPSLRDEVQYNAACGYAVASLHAEEKREVYCARAMELLENLLDQAYFERATNTDHLSRDTDLDPLRAREDFAAFLKAAQSKVKTK